MNLGVRRDSAGNQIQPRRSGQFGQPLPKSLPLQQRPLDPRGKNVTVPGDQEGLGDDPLGLAVVTEGIGLEDRNVLPQPDPQTIGHHSLDLGQAHQWNRFQIAPHSGQVNRKDVFPERDAGPAQRHLLRQMAIGFQIELVQGKSVVLE